MVGGNTGVLGTGQAVAREHATARKRVPCGEPFQGAWDATAAQRKGLLYVSGASFWAAAQRQPPKLVELGNVQAEGGAPAHRAGRAAPLGFAA